MSTIGDMDVRLNLITNNFKSGMSQASEALGRFVRTTVSDFQRVNNAAEDASNSTSLFQSKWSKNWKDVARMAQGIIFSQAFYKIASDIREASNAIKDFSRDCEDAQASFSILMKCIYVARYDTFATLVLPNLNIQSPPISISLHRPKCILYNL